MVFSSRPWAGAVAAATAALLASTAYALDFQSVPSPDLDLSQLGRVALTGDFDAISLYSFVGQNENAFTTNGSQALLTQMPNGLFKTLEASDGFIFTACSYVRSNGDLSGVVVGGNFTSLGNNPAQGVALWDPNTDSVTPLPGLNGSVNAVWCQKETDSVYVGGSFHGANSTNAIVWIGSQEWSNMPFEGFDGPVNAVAQVPGSSNVIFAGQFSTIGNLSAISGGDDGGALMQQVNLGTSSISAASTTDQSGLDDPRNIVCKTAGQDGPGNTWLLRDNSAGVWKVQSQFDYAPTKLRLYNTRYQGRGTKTFAFRAFPENGQLNMTYTDPSDGQNKSCIQTCPLSNDPKVEYQDFEFVNVIDMTGFQVEINGWYGAGGGLDGIELLTNADYVYANSSFNAPSCSNSSFPSNSSASGPWQYTPAGQNGADYLTADLTGPGVNSASASVTFYPEIQQAGLYMAYVDTPGCLPDNTCQQRGIANVTWQFQASQPVGQKNIYQTNNYVKFDELPSSNVDLPSSSFRPYVRIQPLDDQDNSISLTALRVRFDLIKANGSSSASDSDDKTTVTSTTTTMLNGIYEYNPNNATINPDFTDSPLNVAGTNLSMNALINSIATVGSSLYIAGNFSGSGFTNIFQYSSGASTALDQGGLNDQVSQLIAWGNLLFIGGDFNNTQSGATPLAKGVVAYDTVGKSWMPLGGGVDGSVTSIVPLSLNITPSETQSCITVNGDFGNVLAGPNTRGFNASDGFAIWVPAYGDWLQNLNIAQPAITGQLTTAVNYTSNETLLAGTISSQGMAIQDVVALTTSNGQANISSLGLQEPSVAALGQNKAPSQAQTPSGISGAVTGLFALDTGHNIAVVGGNFETTATNGSNIRNLAFIDTASNGSSTITGVASGLDSNSTFVALARAPANNTVYAGGLVTGHVNGGAVNGLVLWDLGSSQFSPGQPPALGGTANVSVNTITVRPKSSEVYVGGNFIMAGALPCAAVCKWASNNWASVGVDFTGVVNAQMWQGNDNLLVGGNVTSGSNHSYLATLNANANANEQAWTTVDAPGVPGPVNVLTPANSQNSQYWLGGMATNGSSYIMYYDGSNFNAIPQQLGNQSVVRGLSVLSLQSSANHAATSFLGAGYVLLITGSLNVPGFGNASAALFNGSAITPFILSNSGNGPGSMSQLVSQTPQSFTTGSKHLALGFVVLIALAIALGLIFILVVLGLALERWRRRREGYRPAPQNYVERTANMGRIPPDQLLGNLSRGNEGPRI